MSETVYIALGSNIGDRRAFLATARREISALEGTVILAASTIVETDPIGPPGQDPYLNQMLAVSTSLEPDALLSSLQAIERAARRERGERWGPRTLDLDIVRFGERVVDTPSLTIPHPEIPRRDFWLRGLRELGCETQS